jgi:nucleoside-diphosphate-sugar epimerase
VTGRIVVTGASGFIGRWLVARLTGRGRAVAALGRPELESTDGSLQRAVTGADCVVHLAARAHRGGTDSEFHADVALTQSLARLASQCGVRRFVHMSSIGVLGTRTHGVAFSEATEAAPQEPYAQAKLRAEEALQRELAAAATEWVIVRPPMVHGPDAPGNFHRLLRAVQRGWPLPFAQVRNRRALIGIENLLDALEACMDHPAAARQVFLVADADPVSTAELVRLIAHGLGVAPRLWSLPPAWLAAAARATGRRRMAESLLCDLEIDTGHIARALGWQPRIGAREAIVHAAAAGRT